MSLNRKIRVLVIDDSAFVRSLLRAILNDCDDIECIGAAPDPLIAREMIRNLDPDVLTLDVEMPKMDGLAFLEKLMCLRPTPVIMVSTLTERGTEVALRALELGAVDIVAKPQQSLASGLDQLAEEIREKVRVAARVRPRRSATRTPKPGPQKVAKPSVVATPSARIIAIGASTGGTEAIRDVLSLFPPDAPGTVITQHIPERFAGPFAARLDSACAIRVKLAEQGDPIMTGHAYVAPGDQHLCVVRKAGLFVIELSDAPPVNRHKPSVDVMFSSVASAAGKQSVGVLLTGMGKDGANGLLEMRTAGAVTIAQDEATCVVFGMPREAIAVGAVVHTLPLSRIPESSLRAGRGTH